jgi:hypothetical protein
MQGVSDELELQRGGLQELMFECSLIDTENYRGRFAAPPSLFEEIRRVKD